MVELVVGGSSAQPSFNVVGDSGMSQMAQLQMTPTQAYVVSGDNNYSTEFR